MRKLVSVIALVAMTTAAAAQFNDLPQTMDVTDVNGVKVGTATKFGNNITLRDAKGEMAGTIELLPDGGRLVRDANGKLTGTVSADPDGKLTFHKADGE